MDYNPFLPEVKDNPYPYYAYLRQHAPVYEVPGVGFWVVSRYDDVLSLLKTPQVFSSTVLAPFLLGDLTPFSLEVPPFIAIDPPDHTRLRKLANRAFTPRRIASLESHLREVVRQLLEPIVTQGTFDLISDLAVPLPIIAIAELLGVPPERYLDFKRWTNDIVKGNSRVALTAEEETQIRLSIAEFRTYFQEAIAAYRQQPGDNLLSDLVRAEEEEQRLSAEEVLSMALLLLAAGAETTTNLIGNAMLALLNHPEQLAEVRNNLALVSNVVEETLRYDSVVQVWPRMTLQEITIADTTLSVGSVVMFMPGSANRDERKFPDPDRFDIHRSTDAHVGFGFGIHFCIGAPLARLETKVALEMLLARFPRIARTDEPYTRIDFPFFRGLKSLPLTMS